MGKHTETGFTVIEVMLFLAVTGLLAVGILVGSGVTIGQQRYRDSVNNLKSFIQQQYSEVSNVSNDRNKGWNCDATGEVTEDATGQPRGTSDCVLLGRLITIDVSGTKLTAANVVGYHTPGAPTASSDIEELKDNYRLGISPIEPETQEVPWGAQIVKQNSTNPMPLSILIVRSPLNGSLFTFSLDNVQTDPNSLINDTSIKSPRDLCVNADSGTFVGKRMEVRIDAYAANQSAVRIPTESESVCG